MLGDIIDEAVNANFIDALQGVTSSVDK